MNNRKYIVLGDLLKLFEHDSVQIYFEGSGDDWENATELPPNSPFLTHYLSWNIKEAEIVDSKLDDQTVLRLGIFEPAEDK